MASKLLRDAGMPDAQRIASDIGTVPVVSGNVETLDGMHEYFRRTGIASSSRRTLILGELGDSVRALVVFPDDFPVHERTTYLSMARARRPDLAIVVVTGELRAYETMVATNGVPLNAIVLARPAFGWAIVDALRAHIPNSLASDDA